MRIVLSSSSNNNELPIDPEGTSLHGKRGGNCYALFKFKLLADVGGIRGGHSS